MRGKEKVSIWAPALPSASVCASVRPHVGLGWVWLMHPYLHPWVHDGLCHPGNPVGF